MTKQARFLNTLTILPRWIIVLLDTVVFALSAVLAYALRLNFEIDAMYNIDFMNGVGLFTTAGLLSIILTKSYAGIIRYTGVQDGMRVLGAISLAFLISLIANNVLVKVYDRNIIPYSVLIIGFLVSAFSLIIYRLLVKELFEFFKNGNKTVRSVVIFGAGRTGMLTRQVISKDNTARLRMVGFLEDDQSKVGKVIDGIRIYDAKKSIKDVFEKYYVDEVIIAIPDLPLDRKNQVIDICLEFGVRVSTVPPLENWTNGELSAGQIKKVNIEDLLGRESIKLDNSYVRDELSDKVVMITGAAGSIGSEIVRQVAGYQPAAIIMVDQWETGLFDIDGEVAIKFPLLKAIPILSDIRDESRMKGAFETFRPDIIFHAAAYKHVPMIENNPSEGISCNIKGTKILADLATAYHVEKFVMISTDKAVNPSNVMGASKRIAEIYVQSLNNFLRKYNPGHTKFITTRFGNVLGSNGSVIPLFKKQIEEGGPIRVTHPEITRYFMTIPEACQLVLEAGVMGKGGEIFIFDMGQPIKIVELAKKMIRLSGLKLDVDIKIQFTGLRDGEKLFEELLNNQEVTLATHHPKIMVAKVREYDFEEVKQDMLELSSLLEASDEMQFVAKMKSMVPEYVSNASRFTALDK
ncbi:polysaccharide biosynthesis protein [Penaeicola halotolerans]|uniref:polysaccharide biosynthesis protein n=1 Tax=Penaeicola halotolerans TaxID=2793196 RepID=UPI001CF922C1|nr:nucleoside-diphosphate sugar epimerase/dehydratase [Penaeicola halotolerans]